MVLNAQSKRLTSNVIGFRDGDRFFGNDAHSLRARFPLQMLANIDLLAGRAFNDSFALDEFASAEDLEENSFRKYLTNEMHFMPNITAHSRGGFRVTPYGNLSFSTEELLGMMCGHIKKMVANHARQPATHAVLSLPAGTSLRTRHAFVDAFAMADVQLLAVVPQGLAAAVQWGVQRRDAISARGSGVPTFLVIVDVGAAKAEASVVAFVPTPSANQTSGGLGGLQLLGSATDYRAGGKALDHALAIDLIRRYREKSGSPDPLVALPPMPEPPADADDEKAVSEWTTAKAQWAKKRLAHAKQWVRLLAAAEDTRTKLSANAKVRAIIPADVVGGQSDVMLDVLREEAEGIWEPTLARVVRVVEEATKRASGRVAGMLRTLKAAQGGDVDSADVDATPGAEEAETANKNDKGKKGKGKKLVGDALAQAVLQSTARSLADATTGSTTSDETMARAAVDAVELFGGTSRTPALQRMLTKMWGSRLQKTLNTDEAAALGTTYVAAQLSAGMRVKTHLPNITLPREISIRLSPSAAVHAPDGVPAKAPTMRSLFKAGGKVPHRRVVTVNRTEDFSVAVFETPFGADGQPAGPPRQLAVYEVRGVADAYAGWLTAAKARAARALAAAANATESNGTDADKPAEPPLQPEPDNSSHTVRLVFRLNATGVVGLESGEAHFTDVLNTSRRVRIVEKSNVDENATQANRTGNESAGTEKDAGTGDANAAKEGEDTKAANDDKSANGDDGKADSEGEEGEHADAAGGSDAKDTDAREDASDLANETSANETANTTQQPRFETVYSLKQIPKKKALRSHAQWTVSAGMAATPLSRGELRQSSTILNEWDRKDEVKVATATARNDLETFLYETRTFRILENEALQPFFEGDERANIERTIAEVTEWLEDGPGSDATTPEPLKAKQDEIRAAVAPVLARLQATIDAEKAQQEAAAAAEAAAQAAQAAADSASTTENAAAGEAGEATSAGEAETAPETAPETTTDAPNTGEAEREEASREEL
eukprot:TRINITY_DN3547_c0_g1_i1.p1 TRINITY_DN3547_c0_g1~~TRINITY_DN3547_c0_g1_i1.p1  ORF type:complete len:1138 (-),score=288.77 TRINITY_DN3547_c0_g1_i1:107-3127(-)